MIDTEVEKKGSRIEGVLSPEMPAPVAPGDQEISLLDLCLPLVERRVLIGKATAISAAVALVVALLIPNKYTAMAKIMPPQQSQSSASAMLGQLGQLGALAGLTGGKELGLKNPSDLYVGILKSRTIADALIAQFSLERVYKDKRMTDAREDLAKHATIDSGKDGMISIAFEDTDPKRAAAIANAYVDQLYLANQRLAISEASQRRLFYEKQLEAEKDALASAEVDLKKTQEATGLIQLNSQAEAIIRAVASLRAQITTKEVQLQAMRLSATEQNPQLERAEQELSALRAQMSKLENKDSEKLGGGNIQVPTGKVPEVGLEYMRKLREVKYHEQLFEILARQYEAARIDEGKSASLIQVVDQAVVPDKKTGPMRSLIVIIATFLGAMLCCFYVWGLAGLRNVNSMPEQKLKMRALKEAWSSKSIRQN